ncbi:hypothetical protein [Neobacillus drentensis]|uniref:hypothetical protein n=1 Tax=Neobacillus drentensis TaxID=220684 RepID=UPI000826AC1D|nr:hypothetical protein [Neobacillus drentensis]
MAYIKESLEGKMQLQQEKIDLLKEQKKIIQVLSTLDNKINLEQAKYEELVKQKNTSCIKCLSNQNSTFHTKWNGAVSVFHKKPHLLMVRFPVINQNEVKTLL